MGPLLVAMVLACDEPPRSDDTAAPDVSLAERALRIEDTGAYRGTGEGIAAVGDLDGDGLGDVAIGSRGAVLDGQPVGRLTIELGPFDGDRELGRDAIVVWGQDADDEFGKTVLGEIDVDLDGVADLVAGCSLCDGVDPDAGQVVVLLGPVVDHVLQDQDAVVTGDQRHAHLGRSLAAAGDVDEDGWPDLLAGANGTGDRTGSAYLIAGPLHQAAPLDEALFAVHGEVDDGSFGTYLARLGDTDGDGVDELAISAYQAELDAGSGVVHVFASSHRGVVDLQDADAVLVGTEAWTGRPLVPTADATGDGLADLLVGAPHADCAQGAKCGQAFMMAGPLVGELSPDAAWMSVHGERAGMWLAQDAVWADVDEDGQGDAVLGTFSEDGPDRSGGLLVVSGPGPGSHLESDATWLAAPTGTGRAGSHLAAGDVDGDGVHDVLAGDDSGADVGGAWLLWGVRR
ncbi:MAG: hypothetical protein GY913_33025 [Proteobacteria bacterium]|nr:hypothetical protein [Pseudomonadota bacterium]MCP4921748.1 hypothetical protein [Pseudomonadota bacterium]